MAGKASEAAVRIISFEFLLRAFILVEVLSALFSVHLLVQRYSGPLLLIIQE